MTLVLFAYTGYIRVTDWLAWPGVDTIAADTRLSDTAVRKVIRELRRRGIFELVTQGGGVDSFGRGRSNRYRVRLDVLEALNPRPRLTFRGERQLGFKGERGERFKGEPSEGLKGERGVREGSTVIRETVNQVAGNNELNIEKEPPLASTTFKPGGGAQNDLPEISPASFRQTPELVAKSLRILRRAGIVERNALMIALYEPPWVCKDAVDVAQKDGVDPTRRPNYIFRRLRPKGSDGRDGELSPDGRRGLEREAESVRLARGMEFPYWPERQVEPVNRNLGLPVIIGVGPVVPS